MHEKKTIAFVLAGGKKPSLDILSRKRAKAAIPFGTIYRVIDFALSNLMHSEISHVGVLTQYRPESLMDHIANGEAWDWQGRRRGIKILPPYQRQENSDWYKGTADAVYQNLNFISDRDPETVMLISGDHIYRLDYRQILNWHYQKGADITLVVRHFPAAPPSRFGLMDIDQASRIIAYEEKPETVRYDYISLGIYVFKTEILVPLLIADAGKRTTHDIGRDIIGPAIESGRVFAYPYEGPWFYLNDIRAYWEANMDLLGDKSLISLDEWGIETNMLDGNIANYPPTRFRGAGLAQNSMVANGCLIEGTVRNSIIFPGVRIEHGAVVEESILMNDVSVGSNTSLYEVIVDKNVSFGSNVRAGFGENIPNHLFPEFYSTGISVFAKSVRIADSVELGRNVLVYNDVNEEFSKVPSGQTVGGQE